MVRFFVLIGLSVVVMTGMWGRTNERAKIAILRIENRLDIDVDTDALTESLQIEVVGKRHFLVVERGQLSKIFEEQKLSLAGLTEAEQAAQVGRLSGAQKIWVGSLARFGERYVITMRSIDANTGVIDFADQVFTHDIEGLLDVMPDLADRMIRKARGEDVPTYVARRAPPAARRQEARQEARETAAERRARADAERPDTAFDVGLYNVVFVADDNPQTFDGGGALSVMWKSPANRHAEFYLEGRFYRGTLSNVNVWDIGGFNMNMGMMLNLIANGFVLFGGGIGIGIDFPTFTRGNYSISAFEWTIPLSAQFGFHFTRNFMLMFEASIVPGFGLSIMDNNYPTTQPGVVQRIGGESHHVPRELAYALTHGMLYVYTGLRLSFLF